MGILYCWVPELNTLLKNTILLSLCVRCNIWKVFFLLYQYNKISEGMEQREQALLAVGGRCGKSNGLSNPQT